ncbi:hypothetical protein Misp01_08970 [Microtetraspora sp. NBRC 13810]|uniref:helix-turn-helix domain-containing protein n=1 Tax=Microtetraspora sp. NBRC 13810 TaxID=3030990 RepID=UPI0024A2C2B8|nr:helix-turn-helix transcriptional regulator [Microtetraspora sp. NBRC 13810]GLW05767.1 hypothetical protein Misp01_08970 [Microtetraspora sp. NBRC 13810]
MPPRPQPVDPAASPWHLLGAGIRHWRDDVRGISQRTLAEQVHIDDALISQYERGLARPHADTVRLIDEATGAGGHLVALHRNAQEMERLRGLQSQRVRAGTVEAESDSSSDEEDDMERRRLMRDAAVVAAVGTVAPLLTALTDAWQASESRIAGASVSQSMIDDWEDAADVHAKAARVDRPDIVLAALAADFADMAPHLARKQPDEVRRDLAHAAARHAALIAGKWADMANRREARRWWMKTRTLIDESGDHLLASWLRSREALHRRGDPAEDMGDVLKVAQEARRLAGERPSAALVAAMTAEAKTLSVMGLHEDAVQALRAAERVFDQLPAIPGVFRSLNERGLWFDRSLVYSLAGDVSHATEAHDRAEELYPAADQARPRIRLHRAALHARTDPGSAAQAAVQVVSDLPPGRWITRYSSDAQLVLGALPEKARALPAARELRALTSA